MLLAETPKNGWVSYVLIGIIALMLIALPILMNQRNKKETQKIQEQTNSLKVGDKVLTTSGVYGTITEIKFDDTQKMVVIETGGKNKSYLSVDAYAIYTVFKSEAELKREAEEKALAEEKAKEVLKTEEIKEDKPEEKVEEKVEVVEEKEENAEVLKEEKKEKPAKKSSKKNK